MGDFVVGGHGVVEVQCVLASLGWRVQAFCITTNIGIRRAST
jgi:hypothetical protein